MLAKQFEINSVKVAVVVAQHSKCVVKVSDLSGLA